MAIKFPVKEPTNGIDIWPWVEVKPTNYSEGSLLPRFQSWPFLSQPPDRWAVQII